MEINDLRKEVLKEEPEKREIPIAATEGGVQITKTETSELSKDDVEMLEEVLGEDVVTENSEAAQEQIDDDYTKKDAIVLAKIIDRLKRKEKFSVYNAMTPSLKEKVTKAATEAGHFDMRTRHMFATMMVTQMMQDNEIDSAWDKLQKEFKEASKMPDHMDFYGAVMYDKLCSKSLIKAAMYEEKEIKESADLYIGVARTYLDVFSFHLMIAAVKEKPSMIRKAVKYYKRACDDIDFKLKKLGIVVTENVSAATHSKLLINRYGEEKAAMLLCAFAIMVENLDQSTTSKEIAFLISQFMGTFSYLKEDAITDFGKELLDNFNKFIDVCETVIKAEDSWESSVDLQLDMARRYMEEKFTEDFDKAREKFKSDFLEGLNKKIEAADKEKESTEDDDTLPELASSGLVVSDETKEPSAECDDKSCDQEYEPDADQSGESFLGTDLPADVERGNSQ